MSQILGLIEKTNSPSSSLKFAPTRILITLTILIFLAEMIAMAVLYFVSLPNYLVRALLDGIIMSALVLPGLYWLQLKPLVTQTEAERKQRALAQGLTQSVISLNSSLLPEDVLDTILNQIYRSVSFQQASITLIEGQQLHVAGFRGSEDQPKKSTGLKRSYALDEWPLVQQIHATHRPVLIPDTTQDADWRDIPGLEWVRSYLGAPLIRDRRVIGVINLNGDQPGYFNQESVERLMAFAAPAAMALHNAQLYKAESTARQAAETFSAAAQSLTQTLDLEQIVNALLEHIDAILHADVTSVALLEGETRLTTRAVLNGQGTMDTEQIMSIVLDTTTIPLLQELLSTGKSITALEADLNREPLPGLEHIRSWLVVPLVAGDKIIGVVGLGKAEATSFTNEQIQWAEVLAGQGAMAIQNAWLFEQVRSSSDRLQSLARKLVELQEAERYHIARELHDEAGQALSSLKLSLGRLEQDPDCPRHIRRRLLDMKGMVDGVLEELHRLAMDLRPVALDHLGLVAALEQLAGHLNSERLSVQFKAVAIEQQRLPRDLETSLYRIVQEALTNILRHAHAGNVGILLEQTDGWVKLFVEDDGVGFASDESTDGEQLGLVGMRERAEMFGGSLSIESSPGSGTAIIVEVPHVASYSHCR
jgi:signal transduction histidine kinase